jgi:cell wall-associated NlpC family hydrolase
MTNFKNTIVRNVIKISLGLTVTLSAGLSIIPTAAFAASQSNTTADQIISTGEHYIGFHYKHGGHAKGVFDCQGLMKFIFGQAGIDLPNGARNQSTAGSYVSRDQLQPGDLVFFSTVATTKYAAGSIKRIGHVGVVKSVLADGTVEILHTFGKPGVTITKMYQNHGWWSKHYVTARRVL